jgi:type II secretory pathway pseudopilin PulG
MSASLRSERGFMLTELLIACVLTVAVLGAAVGVFAKFANEQNRTEQQGRAEDAARQVLDRISSDLRSAMSDGTTGSQPIEVRSSTNLVYLAPSASASLTNNPRGLVHIRYCLDTSNLTNEVLWYQNVAYDSQSRPTPPSGTSCPLPSYTTSIAVASFIVNQVQSPVQALFTTPTDSAGNVTDVYIRAFVDVDPTKQPAATDLQSSVTLRNLNHPPTAQLTCQALASGHTLCDASASVDSDAQSLTFGWKMDGNPLTSTTYNLDQSGLLSKSSHTFMVTVTDSSGVASSASQTVTMP